MAEVPALVELLDGMRVVSIPMRTRFRGVAVREAALLRGPAGWGEFSPFLEYAAPEAARWLAAGVEAAWQGWPAPVRAEVPVNATVPAVPAERVPEVLARYDGTTTAKVKVAEPGQSLADDLDRVAAVRDVLGPRGRVRVDANGAWSVDDAVRALSALAAHDLEYAEQPCATVPELHDLRLALARRGVDVPVAADESIRKAEDPIRVAREGAAGLPAVVSSALDTSVGMRAGVALAAALPELEHACGLGTVALLAGDVTTDPLVPVRGVLPVRDAAADEELLDRWAAPGDRVEWWRGRVAAAHAVLAG